MEGIEGRDKRGVGIDPNEIPHPAFPDEPRDSIGRVPMGIDKNAAVPFADVLDKEVHEERGFPHARHPAQIYVAGRVNREFLLIDVVDADGGVHA
jgi:hypothetical protein